MAEQTKEINKLGVIRYPNNFEAEQCLLACMLIDGKVVDDYVNRLTEDDFYNAKHKRIFRAIQTIYENYSIDIFTVFDGMRKNAIAKNESLDEQSEMLYLADLQACISNNSSNSSDYYEIVRRDSILRKLIDNCNEIIKKAYSETKLEEILRDAEARIYSIAKDMKANDLVHIKTPLAQLNSRINTLMSDKTAMRGLMTGYKRFDMKTNGLQKGDLIILAARPSVGKTSLALNMATQIALDERKKSVIAVFSLEMPAVQLVQRLICNVANISMDDVSKGEIKPESTDRLWAATKKLGQSSIYIDDSSIQSPKQILSKLRRLSSKVGNVDLVIIDYIGLMEAGDGVKKNDSRQQEVSSISRNLKIIAKEISCPVMVLSQMSRGIEGRPDKDPRLSDLRESGAIEQDADIVMFLSREHENEKGTEQYEAILNIAKHRNGSLGKIRLHWNGPHIRFTESDNQVFSEGEPSTGRDDE